MLHLCNDLNLIAQHSISINFVVSNGITPLAAFITRVTFYGIDPAIFHPLHDAYMVGHSVLGSRVSTWIVPVKENDIP